MHSIYLVCVTDQGLDRVTDSPVHQAAWLSPATASIQRFDAPTLLCLSDVRIIDWKDIRFGEVAGWNTKVPDGGEKPALKSVYGKKKERKKREKTHQPLSVLPMCRPLLNKRGWSVLIKASRASKRWIAAVAVESQSRAWLFISRAGANQRNGGKVQVRDWLSTATASLSG